MSLYDATKDAVKLAQKLNNIELIQKLMDVQEQALEMQEKQLESNRRIDELNREITHLKEMKKYVFASGSTYLIDPDDPTRKLCPVCTKKINTAVPLTQNNGWCGTCERYYR